MHAWHNVAIADLESRHECIHRAYLNSEETWNGWACPYFEKPEVERMSASHTGKTLLAQRMLEE